MPKHVGKNEESILDPTYLYPHQRSALSRLANGKILWGGVGSGKTRVAAAYYMEKEKLKDVYVITTAKKRDSLDWEREFANHAINKVCATPYGGRLTVDSWNNIGRYAEVKDAFFIFDEQRLVGAGSWTKKFLDISEKNNWILLSATPGDTWMDYIPVFIANGFYKNRTEFKRDHVVYASYVRFPKIDRYIGVGKLIRLREQILVHMPYLRHTIRHNERIPVEYDKKLLEKVVKFRWNVYQDEPLKDISQLYSVMRKVVYSHPSRLVAVKRLSVAHPKLIVFYNYDFELEELRKLGGVEEWKSQTVNTESLVEVSPMEVRSGENVMIVDQTKPNWQSNLSVPSLTNPVVAEWNGHKHQPIPKSDSWVYLVQYTAGAEGWNCTDTNAMVFYSQNYSYKVDEQSRGRIDRLDTPYRDLYYYTLMSDTPLDWAVAKALKEKRIFNEVRSGLA